MNGLPRFLGTLIGRLVSEAAAVLASGLDPTAVAELIDRLGSEPTMGLDQLFNTDSAEFVLCTERRRRWLEPNANFTKIFGHCFMKAIHLFTNGFYYIAIVNPSNFHERLPQNELVKLTPDNNELSFFKSGLAQSGPCNSHFWRGLFLKALPRFLAAGESKI